MDGLILLGGMIGLVGLITAASGRIKATLWICGLVVLTGAGLIAYVLVYEDNGGMAVSFLILFILFLCACSVGATLVGLLIRGIMVWWRGRDE